MNTSDTEPDTAPVALLQRLIAQQDAIVQRLVALEERVDAFENLPVEIPAAVAADLQERIGAIETAQGGIDEMAKDLAAVKTIAQELLQRLHRRPSGNPHVN